MSDPQYAYADPALAHDAGPMCFDPAAAPPTLDLLSRQMQADELRRANEQPDSASGPRVLRSDDPAVDGRPVAEVAAELGARVGRYRELVPLSIEQAIEAKRHELRWYEELGVVGGFVDLFNDTDRTDPGRWDAIVVEWQTVGGELERALALVGDPTALTEAGRQSARALDAWRRTLRFDRGARRAFEKHLTGFADGAGDVAQVATVVRDLSFAAAVGLAVYVAAPMVFATASGAAGGVGLTGGAATAAAHAATAGVIALGSGAAQGTARAGAVLVVEGCALLDALLDEETTWQQAIDAIDWQQVADEGWLGFKRGVLDGLLAYAGIGLEKVIAKGAGVAFDRVLGAANRAIFGRLVGRCVERATAAGLSGGVLGALDAGARAAASGATVGEVVDAVEGGFVMGAAVGATVGVLGGAASDRVAAARAARIDALLADVEVLERLLRDDPAAFAERFNALVAEMSDAQREAFGRELRGRRFVDRRDYDVAAAKSGEAPPEHAYGREAFDDWSAAADMLDAHARSGQSLTQGEVEVAHAAAMRRDAPDAAGHVRRGDAAASGGLGEDHLSSALSPEQIATLERNPHLQLFNRGAADKELSLEQRAAAYETAIIVYTRADEVQRALDDFFAWYARSQGGADPAAFAAEAQRRLVSIHPFADGNGRTSRLVMDHALQSRGLPPALLRDPDLDYMIPADAWADEVRAGVVETWQLATRHVDAFNDALRTGDPGVIATRWAALLNLGDDPDAAAGALYGRGPR